VPVTPTTTSATTITLEKLLRRALRKLGVRNAAVGQLNEARELLQDLIREIDEEGRWLWTINFTPTSLTTIAGQRAYTVGVGASNIASGLLELIRVDLVQGQGLVNVWVIPAMEAVTTVLREALGGTPAAVCLERHPSKADQRLHIFPTPTAIWTLQYTYRRQIYDCLVQGESPDFPQDWADTLALNLASRLSPEYGIPLDERTLLAAEAEKLLNKRRASNTENVAQRTRKTKYF